MSLAVCFDELLPRASYSFSIIARLVLLLVPPSRRSSCCGLAPDVFFLCFFRITSWRPVPA